MKCPDCGKELKEVGVLTDDELKDYLHIQEKVLNAQQALKPDVIENYNFTEGQVLEYFKAAFNEMATANFLNYCLRKEIVAKHHVSNDFCIHPVTGNIYIHINE